jgi:hypothetical protein
MHVVYVVLIALMDPAMCEYSPTMPFTIALEACNQKGVEEYGRQLRHRGQPFPGSMDCPYTSQLELFCRGPCA